MSSPIHNKIAALLNVGKDSRTPENERDNAMRLASLLMLKHNISESDVRKDDDKPRMTRGREYEAELAWHETCAFACEQLYALKSLWMKDEFIFLGRPDNVDAGQQTYEFLIEQIEQLYKQSLPKGLSKSERAQYRRQFKFACAERVYIRACRIAREQREGSKEAQEATGSTALVVIEARKQLEQEVNDFMEQIFQKMDQPRKDSKARAVKIKEDHRGARDGDRAGHQVQLNRRIG